MIGKQLDYMISPNLKLDRQGPGSYEETLRAIKLTGLTTASELQILDLGCGTGAQTNVLADTLHGTITAVDLIQPFLDALKERTPHPNVQAIKGSMDQLPFENDSFDLIWSEGAIYNMGFKNGLNYLHSFLKKNGVIALSEITWLTEQRPKEIETYWSSEYPEMDTVKGKMKTITESGYQLLGHFILSEESWLTTYYAPLEKELIRLEANHTIEQEQKEIIESYQNELALYKKYKHYVGYGFYIARRLN